MKHRRCAGVFLALLASCSSLKVKAYTEDAANSGKYVPFFLPRQDFVVTELGLDKDGNPATAKPLQVSLVTRPDPKRGFLIRNRPALLTESAFTVERDDLGRIAAVTAKADDKILDTVVAIAAVAASAAFGPLAREFDDRIDEQEALRKKLLDELKAEEKKPNPDPKKVIDLQDALAKTVETIQRLKARKPKTVPTVGVKPSQTKSVKAVLVPSLRDLPRKSKSVPADKIRVLLVPVD